MDMEVSKVEEAAITIAGEEEQQGTGETKDRRRIVLLLALWHVLLGIAALANFTLNFAPRLLLRDFAKLLDHPIVCLEWALNGANFACMPFAVAYFAILWGKKAPGCVWGRRARSADLVIVVLVSLVLGYCSSRHHRRDLDKWVALGLAVFNVQAHTFVKFRWKVLDYQVHDVVVAMAIQVLAYYNVVATLLHGSYDDGSGFGGVARELFVRMVPCGVVVVFYTFCLDPVLDRLEDLHTHVYRYE